MARGEMKPEAPELTAAEVAAKNPGSKSAQLAAQDEAEEKEGSGRKMDPELRVMAGMLRSLDELEEPARGRVVYWLYHRYAATENLRS
jgi:hypothetical protein